jgi:hypothetical protein
VNQLDGELVEVRSKSQAESERLRQTKGDLELLKAQ